LILGVTGAALSFMITIGSHALATSTEIERLQETSIMDEKKLNELNEELDQLKASENPDLEARIKKLELEIQHRTDDLDYQKKMIEYHQQRSYNRLSVKLWFR